MRIPMALLILLAACAREPSDRRVLASNVVFDRGAAALRKAGGAEVDTDVVVLAENVVFEPSATSTVESDNVQGAIEELSVDLRKVLTGSWHIENRNQEDPHVATGEVTIHDDGTFDLTAGSFAAIGMGSGDGSGFCQHQGLGAFEFLTDKIVAFSHENSGAHNNVVPTAVEVGLDRLVFMGAGGCGSFDRQRLSILTRKPAP